MNDHVSLLPDATRMPVGQAIRLNLWAIVAVAAALASRLLLRDPVGVTGALRAAVALMPVLPALLYLKALSNWIRGLDEMQRHLQIEAFCGAAIGMLSVTLAADLLRTAGVLPRLNFGWEGYFAFTFLLYSLCLVSTNRRLR